ncbi:MAG: hypothetical protein ABIR68_00220 [Ilumatobacteraceae bacterium]
MASALLMPSSRASLLQPDRRADTRHWPQTASARWAVRVALSVPYLGLAAFLTAQQLTSEVNTRLEASGHLIQWGSRDLGSFIGVMYPPGPIAIASVLPGGAVALSWVGALLAGVVLHAVWERLLVRGVSGWLIAVLVVCFAATPAFAFLATEDLSGFLGLALFAVALTAFLRFAAEGDTEGGFVCGLSLGLAIACDPAALIYALCLAGAAAPVALHRYRGQRHSAQASALVIAFPAVSALAGWTFLQWLFTGSPLGWLTHDPNVFAFRSGVLGDLAATGRTMAIGVLVSPLFVISQVLLIKRRREAMLVAVLPLVGSGLALWLGLRVASGHTVVLLGLIALVSVPARPSRATSIVLAASAIATLGLVIGWVVASNGLLHVWVDHVFS